MSNMDMEVLDNLNEADIKILCKNTDIDMMLEPIKHNGKQYAKYATQLGWMKKKSVLVQQNLPRIAYELYMRRDINM